MTRGGGGLVSVPGSCLCRSSSRLLPAEAAASLVGPVALVVDGGPAGTVASTVVDLTGPEPHVLRQGAVTVADIERALAG